MCLTWPGVLYWHDTHAGSVQEAMVIMVGPGVDGNILAGSRKPGVCCAFAC